MTNFDPTPDVAYGVCVTCDLKLATEADATAHRAETMIPGQRSHSTRALNPSREERIQHHVDAVVQDAIDSALNRLQRDVDDGSVTKEEVFKALSRHDGFDDAWEEWE